VGKSANTTTLSIVERADDRDDLELTDGYGEIEQGVAVAFRPGDLVLVEDALDLWVSSKQRSLTCLRRTTSALTTEPRTENNAAFPSPRTTDPSPQAERIT
jgi:hypothetical protein